MSLRGRILLTLLVAVLVPAAVMWFGARREVEERLRDQYRTRVASLAAVIEEDLEREGREIQRRLSTFSGTLAADNRFRAALAADGGVDRAYLLDLAPDAMAVTGLSMLQIHDPSGRILSSGHFRNAFDVAAPELPRRLAALPDGRALTPVRTAEESFLALVQVDSVRIGDERYHVVGGRRVGEAFLSTLVRDPELSVRLAHPDGVIPAGSPGVAGEVVRSIPLPFLAPTTGAVPGASAASPGSGGSAVEPAEARFEIAFDGAVLREIRRSTNVWFGLVLAGATGVSLLLAGWLSGRVTRPLEELASQARRVQLDRLDVPFPTGRRDEIGQLSRVLKAMTRRLRAGARDLKDAERRATLGEMARQVNHDVRNGLVPIRNVLRHLDDVAGESPEELPEVFRQRRRSLASSVSYLETLAGNYERISRQAGSGSADAVAVVESVVEGADAESDVPVRMEADATTAAVRGDPVTIRRIVENLVSNGKDALRESMSDARATSPGSGLDGGGAPRGVTGGVTVTVHVPRASDTVRIVVADTGRGMSEEERNRAFEDFFTTKEEGTGLGLPVVRRLVRDLGGSVRIESEEGHGTRVTVELPADRSAP